MYMALFIVIIRFHLKCCFLFKLVCEHQCKISGADDTLWTGGPGNYTNPKAPTVFSKVRNLVDNEQYAEATAAAYVFPVNKRMYLVMLVETKLLFFKNSDMR
jgi:hypothetical protein